ncbi:vesicle transport through interaction with t-SNAREs homolog 1A-like isoform X2 [Portunus trituberculatus]|uniref:vesicle transport through interaction with t-SNAREs homolog 1A-like isoform X2 n=1 Tax=Portunus trituberculatus TaxID=210409 RepID=UPI001E1CF587|nr:vesicle transport through interaction with t-SNAREs homolog 1A-like isoform X2 [Portunus trituberculatus]
MATLMTEFQQQFATVTADITHKICQIATREEPEQRPLILEVEKLVDEAKELLERMELEVRDAEPAVRERLRAHIRGYQVELRRLEAECSRVRASPTTPGSSAREELLGGGGGGISAGLSAGEEQRQALLDNTETLERTSTRLVQGHKVALETEHIGAQILNDLHSQRQTLSHARQRLRDTDSDLDQSSRVLGSMLRRTLQNRFVLYVAVGAVVVVILIAIYVEVTRH